jgi:hypothetical protein
MLLPTIEQLGQFLNAGAFILPRVKTPGLFIKLPSTKIHTKAAFGLSKSKIHGGYQTRVTNAP